MSGAQPATDIAFNFCTITSRFDTRPSLHESTLAGLASYLDTHLRLVTFTREQYLKLSKPEQAQVKDGPAIILAQFEREGVRDDGGVRCTTGIGLDVDEEHIEFNELRTLVAGTAAIVYESANSTPSARRWRVLIPFTRPATPQEHERVFEHWSRIVPGVGAASRNPSRLWYGVTQFKQAAKRVFEVLEGVAFDPSSVASSPRSGKEAFLRRVKPPVDTPASEGGRNAALSRFALSVMRVSDTFEAFSESLFKQNEKYEPPLPDKEVMQMAKSKWKKFAPEIVKQVEPDAESIDDADFFLDILAMSKATPVGPHWIIPGWLPGGTVTLHSGDGGSGKSLVAFDIAISLALGLDVFGKPCKRQRVMIVSAEDDEDILHWRMQKICVKYKRKIAELDGWLFIRDATRDVNVLYSDNKLSGAHWTDRADIVFGAMQACEASLLVLDNASDHYDANENERAKVRAFVTGMNARLTREQAVLLLAHVDAVTALNPHDSKGYSGSTAWNNSVRSRWFQYRDKETGKIILALKKANYAQAGEMVEVEWSDAAGVFLIGQAGRAAATLDEHAALFLRMIEDTLKDGVSISPGRSANNNLAKMLKPHRDLPKDATPAKVFDLMDKLLMDGFLTAVEVTGRNGRTSRQLDLTPKGRIAMGKGET